MAAAACAPGTTPGLSVVEARPGEVIESARFEVEGLRADVDVAMAKLAGARDEAVAAADARVAGAESRLLRRLDELAAGLSEAVQRSAIGHEVLARLATVERDALERFGAFEQRFGVELRRLVEAVDDLKAESVTSGDVESVRTEAGAGTAALAASVDTAFSRLASMEERLAEGW